MQIIRSHRLGGPNADLSIADLTGTDLAGANLRSASLNAVRYDDATRRRPAFIITKNTTIPAPRSMLPPETR
ncbi:pentapeptide repeat-containing protein [Nocardia testacea]|uniref:pentapeptide repeat-containing protein n=1 Tax=Nocardia testacea TaxID=248551 RepID=UPI003C2BE1BF